MVYLMFGNDGYPPLTDYDMYQLVGFSTIDSDEKLDIVLKELIGDYSIVYDKYDDVLIYYVYELDESGYMETIPTFTVYVIPDDMFDDMLDKSYDVDYEPDVKRYLKEEHGIY